MEEKTTPEIEKFLKTGAHIGTRFKTGDMQRYIFKQRKDGLKVLDVEGIENRLKLVAAFLARYDTARIVVASKKIYGRVSAKMFAELTGAKALTGRFVPGTFTNPLAKQFIEPEVVIVTDPDSDRQAVDEATKVRAVVVALCSTNNYLRNVDLVIPMNNKGRKSLALAYWILAKELLKAKGFIKTDAELGKGAEDFEYKMVGGEEREEDEEEKTMRRNRGRRDSRGKTRAGRH